MQLVVPIAVTAADAAAIKILSRISPHDVFFIILFFFYLPQIPQIIQINLFRQHTVTRKICGSWGSSDHFVVNAKEQTRREIEFIINELKP